jgi:hypothetical protein
MTTLRKKADRERFEGALVDLLDQAFPPPSEKTPFLERLRQRWAGRSIQTLTDEAAKESLAAMQLRRSFK